MKITNKTTVSEYMSSIGKKGQAGLQFKFKGNVEEWRAYMSGLSKKGVKAKKNNK